MNKTLSFLFLLVLSTGLLFAQERVNTLTQELRNPDSQKVLVVSHRGDWRNAPENSLQAFRNCLNMNVDMIEIDLKQTKDGHLVLMHDETIDRTTNGKGRPSDYTLEELRQFRLINGLGRVTDHVIPTLEEVLNLCKGKILINIDKGYDFFKEVYELTERTGTTGQVVIKSSYPLSKVRQENGDVLDKVIYMPIIQLDNPDAERILDEYLTISPVAIECCFQNCTSDVLRLLQKIKSSGVKIWINSLWASLNAGHDDDRAVEKGEVEESWGWIVSQGATLIQTDRPAAMISYLKEKGLHD